MPVIYILEHETISFKINKQKVFPSLRWLWHCVDKNPCLAIQATASKLTGNIRRDKTSSHRLIIENQLNNLLINIKTLRIGSDWVFLNNQWAKKIIDVCKCKHTLLILTNALNLKRQFTRKAEPSRTSFFSHSLNPSKKWSLLFIGRSQLQQKSEILESFLLIEKSIANRVFIIKANDEKIK